MSTIAGWNFGGEWQFLSLEDCMAEIIDYRGKSPKKSDYGIPLVTAKVVKDGRIQFENGRQEYIPEADYDEWMRRGMPKAGDVVMTTEAPLGEIAQLDNRKVALAQRLITLRGKPDLLNNTYLKHLMLSDFVQEQLRARATGTTVLGIRQSELRKILLALPPLPIQRRIAEILGRLDDKIEVNRRINRTLEAMAQALYQHWFVDFGPFQDGEFVESELGLIPVGWRVGVMEDLFVLQRGFDLPTRNRIEGSYPIYAASGLNSLHIEYKVKGPGVVTGRSGKLGEVFYVPTDFWPLNTTLWIRDFRAATPLYAYHFLQRFSLDAFNSGSAVPTSNRNHIHGMPAVIPPQNVVQKYEQKVSQWFKLRHHNMQSNEQLAAIRDYLLPKLLSGEVPVHMAEEMVA